MTLDFIKIKVEDTTAIKQLWGNPLLYFHSEGERLLSDNETLHLKRKRQYKGIIFEPSKTKYNKEVLYIHFKPHYYFNDNLHNANDFGVFDCIQILKEFASIFNVDLNLLFIINIEFGLNIVVPKELISVTDLLVYMIYHGKNRFYPDSNFTRCIYSTSTDRKGRRNDYKILKCYDKGIQFPQYTDPNTFRIELKSNKKTYINKLGILTFADLLNPNIYDTLCSTIISEFDNVLIIDETAKPQLSKTKLVNFKKKLNPLNWHKLLYQSRNLFSRHLNDYHEALDTCSNHLKKDLSKLIKDKLEELKMCADLMVYKGEICTQSKTCKITGLNISMQKDKSILLSHTGLKYYYKYDKRVFDQVKRCYLSKKWNKSNMDKQITEIAHNIRNTDSNQKIQQCRLYKPQQLNLLNDLYCA